MVAGIGEARAGASYSRPGALRAIEAIRPVA
jgi:hypothetical protein